jgi:hypothetical protein
MPDAPQEFASGLDTDLLHNIHPDKFRSYCFTNALTETFLLQLFLILVFGTTVVTHMIRDEYNII